MSKLNLSPLWFFQASVGLLIAFGIFLSILRVLASGTLNYWYLVWNLFLAVIPVVFAYILYTKNPHGIKFSVKNIALLCVWLLFLPNAFYLVSDLIHLAESPSTWLVYDIVLFTTYALAGLIFGYTSLAMVHKIFYQRFKAKSYCFVFGVLFLSGYAIYLGRYLRWNSWDIITNPFGIIFDISSSIINPSEYMQAFGTTALFFVFLSIIYIVLWRGFAYARSLSVKI
jgi:uncharacterized membrane protein